MHAIRLHAPGGANSLRYQEIPEPASPVHSPKHVVDHRRQSAVSPPAARQSSNGPGD